MDESEHVALTSELETTHGKRDTERDDVSDSNELIGTPRDAISVSQYLMVSDSKKGDLAARGPSISRAASKTHIETSAVSTSSLRAKSGTWAKLDREDEAVSAPKRREASRGQDSQTGANPEASGAYSLDTNTSLKSTSGRPQAAKKTARELWKRAIAVANQVSVLTRFRTLRDHRALEISRDQLVDIKRIGEGAFAVVERCTWLPSKRVVAIKRLKPHVVSQNGGEEMLKEIALLKKLRNRNIVEFVGFGSWDTSSPEAEIKSVFMVEEFVDGGTLKALLAHQMKSIKDLYKLQDAVRWLMQIASGLAYLHQCQPMVIHRDLKLENILLQGKEVTTQSAKIADFGLSALISPFPEAVGPARSRPSYSLAEGWTKNARSKIRSFAGNELLLNVPGVREEYISEEEAVRRQLTKMRESSVSQSVSAALRVSKAQGKLTGRLGTLMYMAPEVYMKRPYNDKADVYSFAIIAYELLHRYQMISATDGSLEECMAYAHRAAHSNFRPPLDESLPKGLKVLITRCWSANPEDRPTMEEATTMLLSMLRSYSFDRHERKQLEARDEISTSGCCCFCC